MFLLACGKKYVNGYVLDSSQKFPMIINCRQKVNTVKLGYNEQLGEFLFVIAGLICVLK
jgi:hypothetical protein